MSGQKHVTRINITTALAVYALTSLLFDYACFVAAHDAPSTQLEIPTAWTRYLALATIAFQALIGYLAISENCNGSPAVSENCDDSPAEALVTISLIYFIASLFAFLALYYQYLVSLGRLIAALVRFVATYAVPALAATFAVLAAAVPALRRGDPRASPLAVLFAFLAAALAIVSLI